MIIDVASIEKYKGYLGGKTLKLKDLLHLGLNVPRFVAIPSTSVAKIIGQNGQINEAEANNIAQEIIKILKVGAYAVRSSALIEDSYQESFAGQFQTKINIPENGLSAAISEVAKQAHDFLKGKIEKFSIIIQEYIEPDFSGVAFTRDPLGGREMTVEFHLGKGEDLVSGKIKPEKIKLFWNSEIKKLPLPKFKEAVEKFKKIEAYYQFPQDVEWCVKGDAWYFLQTRPITSITKIQYQQSLYLDEILPRGQNFYFEKTEISEIAARPTEFTLGLLQKIYGPGGSVYQVYKKYNVDYEPRNFIKIFGNELLCNKEEEIKTLLPSYSYLGTKDLWPKFRTSFGFIRTIKNLYNLHKIRLENFQEIFNNLRSKIEENYDQEIFLNSLSRFLENYRAIFEANLLSQMAVKKLAIIIKKDKNINLASILSFGWKIAPELSKLEINASPEELIGNSLEISDESKFLGPTDYNEQDTKIFDAWWAPLSAWKKKALEPIIKNALIYNRLRETGRWLVVKEISAFRRFLSKAANEKKFKNPMDIYFAKLDEIINNQIFEQTCQTRKNKYSQYSKFNIPKTLTNIIMATENRLLLGVSPGIAKGILVEESDISDVKHQNIEVILYVKILSPDLVKYFSKIKGIISEEGGLLSHLAIIAREQKIPVIVNYNLRDNAIELGSLIGINGGSGEIKKIQL